MANNEIKTNAEIYREQRKERLAKASKKKNHGKHDNLIRLIVKIISVILIVALVLFGTAKVLTDVFCVPQKILTAATYGDEKLTVAEYNYYYMNLYNQAVQLASQYTQQYGQNISGFDTTVSPSEQEYVGEDAGENVETWADYFMYTAHERGFLTKAVYKDAMSEDAKKAGFKLTDEQTKEMNDQIKEVMDYLADGAKKNDYALDNYIAKTCGEGLTEKSYKELLERDFIAQYYLNWYQENATEKATDEDIANYYKENKAYVDIASIRYFTVSYAETEGKDGFTQKEAKAQADKFLASVTDEKSFIELSKEYAPKDYKENYADDDATLAENINASTLESISEDMAKWSMNEKRAKGNIAVFDSTAQECYYIVYIVEPAHKNSSSAGVDIRHLLVEAATTTTDAEGKTVDLPQATIDKNFKEAKAEADKLLKQFQDGKQTEDAFAALATNYTDDPGSKETGGLYEDITSESSYVPEFLDWSLAPHKKGDTGIIKTDYGYHIMYFVGADQTQKWESDVRNAIGTDAYDEYNNSVYDKIHEESKLNDGLVEFFSERILKVIDRSIAYSASNQTVTY